MSRKPPQKHDPPCMIDKDGMAYSKTDRDPDLPEAPYDAAKFDARMQELALATAGRTAMRYEQNEGRVYPQFTSLAPPDVGSNSRVVAVLGTQTALSWPSYSDSFMLCDFCLFFWLLQGATPHQRWLHALDLDTLTHGYTYVHGNPFKEGRKIVLDKTLLEDMNKSPLKPKISSQISLRQDFLKALGEEYHRAEEENQSLIVLIFAHGDPDASFLAHTTNANHAPNVTDEERKNPSFMLHLGSDPQGPKGVGLSDFQEIFTGQVDVTFMTSACFSAGWVTRKYQDMNMTGMNAAGPTTSSRSWLASASASRYGGSMWASAVLEELLKHPETGRNPQEIGTDLTEKQDFTYAGLIKAVELRLMRDIDKKGYEHEITFGAQDDDWTRNWRARTGQKLTDFKACLDRLPTYERDKAVQPGDPQHRDPSVYEEVRLAYLEKRSVEYPHWFIDRSGRETAYEANGNNTESEDDGSDDEGEKRTYSIAFGPGAGTGLPRLSTTIALMVDWNKTYFGPQAVRWEAGGTEVLHSMSNALHAMDAGHAHLDLPYIEHVYNVLVYRFEQMRCADLYIQELNIPRPLDKYCTEFNDQTYWDEHGMSDRYLAIKKLFVAPDGRELNKLWPEPPRNARPWCGRGSLYLICALHNSGLEVGEIHKRLCMMVRQIEVLIDDLVTRLKDLPEIFECRQMWFNTFKLFLSRKDHWDRPSESTLTDAIQRDRSSTIGTVDRKIL